MSVVYHNGKFLDEAESSIPVTDRGFLFGDGVFTTMRVDTGKVRHLHQHLERLKRDCDALHIEMPLVPSEIFDELIARNHAYSGVWRLKVIITGGDEPVLGMPMRAYGQLLVILKPYSSDISQPAMLTVFPYPISKPNARMKSLSYLDRLQVKQYALDHDAFDAIVLSPEGYILETAFSNIFWCSDRVLYTPSRALSLLWGIALEEECRNAEQKGMEVREVKARLDDLPLHAEVFICNSMTGPIRVQLEKFYHRDHKVTE